MERAYANQNAPEEHIRDPEPTVCSGCEGRGEVGGLTPSGYETETCPFCQGTGYEQPE